jgi:hypothetical protein
VQLLPISNTHQADDGDDTDQNLEKNRVGDSEQANEESSVLLSPDDSNDKSLQSLNIRDGDTLAVLLQDEVRIHKQVIIFSFFIMKLLIIDAFIQQLSRHQHMQGFRFQVTFQVVTM